MIRAGALVLLAASAALLMASLDAPAWRRREVLARTTPPARIIDAGPKVIRTIRIDPCDVAKTFVEVWRCRAL